MGFHHLLRRFVENQIGKVELHDMMQPRRKVFEELVEIALRRDCFRNFEQSLELAVQKIHHLSLAGTKYYACQYTVTAA